MTKEGQVVSNVTREEVTGAIQEILTPVIYQAMLQARFSLPRMMKEAIVFAFIDPSNSSQYAQSILRKAQRLINSGGNLE